MLNVCHVILICLFVSLWSSFATNASQTAGGLGAALQSYNRDKKPVPSDDPEMKRNKSVGKLREISQFQPPSALSRSLGPFQGTPSSQLRRLDTPESLVARRGFGQAMKGTGNRSTSLSTGILVASSPPHLQGMLQKVSLVLASCAQSSRWHGTHFNADSKRCIRFPTRITRRQMTTMVVSQNDF